MRAMTTIPSGTEAAVAASKVVVLLDHLKHNTSSICCFCHWPPCGGHSLCERACCRSVCLSATIHIRQDVQKGRQRCTISVHRWKKEYEKISASEEVKKCIQHSLRSAGTL